LKNPHKKSSKRIKKNVRKNSLSSYDWAGMFELKAVWNVMWVHFLDQSRFLLKWFKSIFPSVNNFKIILLLKRSLMNTNQWIKITTSIIKTDDEILQSIFGKWYRSESFLRPLQQQINISNHILSCWSSLLLAVFSIRFML